MRSSNSNRFCLLNKILSFLKYPINIMILIKIKYKVPTCFESFPNETFQLFSAQVDTFLFDRKMHQWVLKKSKPKNFLMWKRHSQIKQLIAFPNNLNLLFATLLGNLQYNRTIVVHPIWDQMLQQYAKCIELTQLDSSPYSIENWIKVHFSSRCPTHSHGY